MNGKLNYKIEELKQNLLSEIDLMEKIFYNYNRYFINYTYFKNFDNCKNYMNDYNHYKNK